MPEGDSVLAFLKGLLGGGGNGEAEPIVPEPGTELGSPKPWEVDLGQESGPPIGGPVGGVDTAGTAQPVASGPEVGVEGGQDDTQSLIEALTGRNEELAPYRDTGLGLEPKRPLRP